jgi:hypothetical protein
MQDSAHATHIVVGVDGSLGAHDPADTLVRVADGAALLVIGCHHSDDRWSVRTGPVAKAVMKGQRVP